MTPTFRRLRWLLLGAIAAALALVAVGGAATGGNFILGAANTADKTTSLTLTSNAAGPALSVTGGGAGGVFPAVRVIGGIVGAAQNGGWAVLGQTLGGHPAVEGDVNGTSGGIGVAGYGFGNSGAPKTGVLGQSDNGTGVSGASYASTSGVGVRGTIGYTGAVDGYGVKGMNFSTQDDNGAGVYGQKAAGGAGVEGYGASGNIGVYAHTAHGIGLAAAGGGQNGLAAVFDGQVAVNGTIDLGLFSIQTGSATPNVTQGNWARLANQNPTTITNLIGNHGQFLIIVCDPNGPDHGNTTIQKGTHLALSSNFTCGNSASTLTLIHDSVQDRWYEVARSINP
jgi:hypothetical protein